MKKLVLFGDSLLGQFGKDRILALEARLPGYDVYNCAAGGWNSEDGVKKARYISKLEPDVVVISLGTNDMAPWKQLELLLFVKNIRKIIRSFSSLELVYFLPPPVNENKESNEKKILNKDAVLYHNAAKQVCIDNGIKFIDSWKVFMPMLQSEIDYHVDDGIHLNDLAYRTVIDELMLLLRK
jgi:lysophospholipase L1-like esterase